MKLHAPVPHRKARIEIIPLIDIMFFLLASFMLVSMSMMKMTSLKLTLPQAATAEKDTPPDFIPINIKVGDELYWGKDDIQVTKDQIVGLVKEAHAAKADVRIYINADTAVTHGMVIEVLDRVRQGGVDKVTFAIKPGGAPQKDAVTPAAPTPPANP